MLEFTTRGTGDRVVFMLHGFLGSGRNLGSLARRLSDRDPRLRILLPDLAGHGSSPPLAPGADLSALARDVLDLAEHQSPSSPVEIAGHSLGGRVAIRTRTLARDRVGPVALLDISPSPYRETETSAVVDALVEAPDRGNTREALEAALQGRGLSRRIVDWLMTNVVSHPEGGYRWRFDRRALLGLHRNISAEDLWPELERGGAGDVWEIRGGASSYVSDADARRLAALGAKVETVEGAGHFLHVDRPDETFRALVSWLNPA